jgi:hypothetical protein
MEIANQNRSLQVVHIVLGQDSVYSDACFICGWSHLTPHDADPQHWLKESVSSWDTRYKGTRLVWENHGN